jgi:hypothetical protein
MYLLPTTYLQPGQPFTSGSMSTLSEPFSFPFQRNASSPSPDASPRFTKSSVSAAQTSYRSANQSSSRMPSSNRQALTPNKPRGPRRFHAVILGVAAACAILIGRPKGGNGGSLAMLAAIQKPLPSLHGCVDGGVVGPALGASRCRGRP